MRVISTVIAALLFAAIYGPYSARSQEYIIGVEDVDYFPAWSLDEGTLQGIAGDMFKEFALQERIQFRYLSVPSHRTTQALIEGQVDLRYPDNPDWGRTAKAGHDVRYAEVQAFSSAFVTLPARTTLTHADLRRVSTVRGFSIRHLLPGVADGSIAVLERDTVREAISDILEGRVDTASFDLDVIRADLLRRGLDPKALVKAPGLPARDTAYHLSSIRHPALVDAFTAWMKTNAQLREVLRFKYGLAAPIVAK